MEVSATGMKLLVSPPDDDGGSPLSGYAIDVQQVPSHKWIRHGIVAPDSLSEYVGRLSRYHSVNVEGLSSYERCRVRLSAVNNAGFVGPPTEKCCHKPEVTDKGTYAFRLDQSVAGSVVAIQGNVPVRLLCSGLVIELSLIHI